MSLKKTFILVLLIALKGFSAIDSTVITEYEKKIQKHIERSDSLKDKISLAEENISHLKEKEATNLRQLNNLEKSIDASQELLKNLTTSAQNIKNDIDSSNAIIAQLDRKIKERKEVMKLRLKEMYKNQDNSLFNIIFNSQSPTDALYKVRYSQDLQKYDEKILHKIIEDKNKQNTQLELLKIQKELLDTLIAQKEEEQKELTSKISERKELLKSISSEKEEWEATVKELKIAQKKMTSFIEKLISERDKAFEEAKKKSVYAFAKRKGSLPWPIDGKIVSHYGKQIHPIHKTVITNKGIGISGTLGETVYSVAPGIVEYVGRLPGYGLVLIINHYDGYMTIYAHLKEVFTTKNSEIQGHQKIATVGESGSLNGVQLHFEIRKGSKSLNPTDWLISK